MEIDDAAMVAYLKAARTTSPEDAELWRKGHDCYDITPQERLDTVSRHAEFGEGAH